ncbi:MAG TPA: hypothetical protein DCM68_01715 [Verrucomicrobia bacterium]|nr:hypothetical protein [Verrucomicrobiota bacterium]
MNRKHMPLLIGGVVALLLAAALSYLLFSAKGSYADGFSGLSNVQGRLQRLTSRAVFPSEPNVQAMGKQVEIYQDYLDGLFESMSQGQIATEPITRDRFRQLMEAVLRQLMNDARAKSVALPPDFAFGFQRYAAGNLPVEEEMGRLVDQLRSIAALCEILYDAGIGELVSVERTVFEKDAQVAVPEEEQGRRGRNRAEPVAVATSTELFRDPDGLFTKEHYVLSYRAQDAANWKALDRLARGAPFTVVTKLEISNPARPAVVPPKVEEKVAVPSQPVSTTGWQAPPGAAGTGVTKEEPAILPRELRVVAGQELPNVRLEVDLYRFAETAVDVAKGEENP